MKFDILNIKFKSKQLETMQVLQKNSFQTPALLI